MNSIHSLFLSLFLLVGSSHAFVVSPQNHHYGVLKMTIPKLSDIDLMAIENVAELCLQAEEALVDDCDLDEHEALVNQLAAQRGILVDQVAYLDDLLNRLKGEGGGQ